MRIILIAIGVMLLGCGGDTDTDGKVDMERPLAVSAEVCMTQSSQPSEASGRLAVHAEKSIRVDLDITTVEGWSFGTQLGEADSLVLLETGKVNPSGLQISCMSPVDRYPLTEIELSTGQVRLTVQDGAVTKEILISGPDGDLVGCFETADAKRTCDSLMR